MESMSPTHETELVGPVHLHVVTEPAARLPSLPAHLTSFIGRGVDIANACALLRDDLVRLVTMTGPGGVGKTSLAIRVAGELEPEFPDGVWFVPLASISDASQVPGAVATTLAIRESGHRTLEEGLSSFLRNQRTLLVLDNFEHVLGAAPFVAKLLAIAPRLTCLVTSRALLRISAEHDLPVLPLPLPSSDDAGHLGQVAEYAAVRLFVERAQAVQSDFILSEANAAQADIFHRHHC
jgi:predicted ATPase